MRPEDWLWSCSARACIRQVDNDRLTPGITCERKQLRFERRRPSRSIQLQGILLFAPFHSYVHLHTHRGELLHRCSNTHVDHFRRIPRHPFLFQRAGLFVSINTGRVHAPCAAGAPQEGASPRCGVPYPTAAAKRSGPVHQPSDLGRESESKPAPRTERYVSAEGSPKPPPQPTSLDEITASG